MTITQPVNATLLKATWNIWNKRAPMVSNVFMNSAHRWPLYGALAVSVVVAAYVFGFRRNAPGELFDRMQAALGGVAQIAAIRDFDESSEAQTFDPKGAPIRVQKRVRWIKPNHLRVDQVGPFNTYVLYFDGSSGWEILPDGNVTDLRGGELEFARKYLANLVINLWLADELPGYSITSPAANVIRVSVQNDPNKQVDLTLDPTSFLPMKSTSISLGDPDRPMPIGHQVDEWTTVQGVRFPRAVRIIRNGRELGRLTTRQINVNTGLTVKELSALPSDHRPVLAIP